MRYADQQRMIKDMLPMPPLMLGVIVSEDSKKRLVKVYVPMYDFETGWCRVLQDTFYPIPLHKTHRKHADHTEHPAPPGPTHVHDEHEDHTPHLPKWPYKPDMEVLVGSIQGDSVEQYVVFGPIDKGPLIPDDEPILLQGTDDGGVSIE